MKKDSLTSINKSDLLSPNELSSLLQANVTHLKGADALKFYYRPYICPFHNILPYVTQNSSLFDIGFGSGLMLLLASKTRGLKRIGGVEISDQLVQKAQKVLEVVEGGDVNLSTFDGMNLPTSISQYDHISMIDVLHHIPKDKQYTFLDGLYEKMSPGSTLIFKDMDASRKFWLLFNKMHDFVLTREFGHEVTPFSILDYFVQRGFKLKAVSTKRMYWYCHFFYLLEK